MPKEHPHSCFADAMVDFIMVLRNDFPINGVGITEKNGRPVTAILTEKRLTSGQMNEVLSRVCNQFFEFKCVGKIRPAKTKKKPA